MEKKTWYVRNTAGKIFGPIDFDSLKSWVRTDAWSRSPACHAI